MVEINGTLPFTDWILGSIEMLGLLPPFLPQLELKLLQLQNYSCNL